MTSWAKAATTVGRALYRRSKRELPTGPLAVAACPRRCPAWALEADFDPATLASNTFSVEWPPRSGNRQEFPEADRAEWFELEEAKRRILPGHAGFLDELAQILEHGSPSAPSASPRSA